MFIYAVSSVRPLEYVILQYINDRETQTTALLVSDEAVQSYKTVDEAVQTDEEPKRKLRLAEDTSGQLANFLRRTEPYIIKQLTNNLRSRAFDGYDVDLEDDSTSVTSLHTLTYPSLQDKFQVTSLSWNSTGSVIGASYGQQEHEDWCTHRSVMCTWNLDRTGIVADKPDSKIEVDSCLMYIAFHPKNPAIVAGGSFNGEVLLWDLSREDDMLIATSGLGQDSHQEPVTKVYWITDAKGKKIYLVSASGDGKIIQWKIDRKAQKLLPKEGFMVMTQSLPRQMKVKGVRGDREIGVTCLSYHSEDRETFIVGSETGVIFKCSMYSQGPPAGSHIVSSIPLRSPVTFTYNPHHGPVYAVECSPFHRNAFVSASMDQCIRLYSLLQAQPVLTIEPGEGYVHSATWSPVKATVIAATTQSGNLLIYDLKQGKTVPVHNIPASSNKEPVYACQFNPQQTHLLATGDGKGRVQIFKLSSKLQQVSGKETEFLGNLVNVTAE
ncbi:cytoplasmic dynein 2 intermediate chain 2-like isoform X2 [Dreissena polymorpha]|uniref:cytoplasmic dynein 2 intermediate chain 2-like isoform X2 n=1 Tax=Dreissena polymorpha TaxID=45954 RepID=UPI0022646391|nr:cytoplasmic dynein 2 intermediate chain 2-like isoform X2 [Dreissena polymorpha]